MSIRSLPVLKKVIDKRFLRIFASFFIALIFLTSCTQSYSYPGFFTSEYCKESYYDLMPNLIALETEKSYRIGYHITDAGNKISRYRFYKIRKTELTDFVYCYESKLFGSNEVILRHKDCSTDPVRDCSVEKIVICYTLDDVTNMVSVADQTIIDEILSAARSYELYFDSWGELTTEHADANQQAIQTDTNYLESNEIIYRSINCEVRIYFNEYDNLVWNSEIIASGQQSFYLTRDYKYEKSFIQQDDGLYLYRYTYLYYVGPNFDSMMKSLLAGLYWNWS